MVSLTALTSRTAPCWSRCCANTLRLTGTHVGCDTSQCGCCTVLVDGQGVKSCTMLAGQADGCRITTIEGLGGQSLHPVQVAFTECHALQCGFCTPLAGNLCRCTGYANIIAAVRQAASEMAGSAA